MPKPSKKVLSLFKEAEEVARLVLDLHAEENRLADTLEEISYTRAIAMDKLADKARAASLAHSNECAERTKSKKRKGSGR